MNTNKESTIRLANENDAEAIATIHVLSWQKIYRGYIADNVLDSLCILERKKRWQDIINQNTKIFLFEKDNQTLGFASICSSRDVDTDVLQCAEISAIYFLPAYWRHGYGKQLCHFVLSELKVMGFKEVILWVLKENVQARKFYENLGFFETSDTKIGLHDHDVSLNEVRYKKILI